ncbi:hypothetical protein MKX01_009303 [Papaver californicum]|nr:hypothetical protein MKX01_009303 [Papaver californicum]
MSSPPTQQKEGSSTMAPPSTDTKPEEEDLLYACTKWIEAHNICLKVKNNNTHSGYGKF